MDNTLSPEFLLYLRLSKGRTAIPRQRGTTTKFITGRGGRIAAEFSDKDTTAFRKLGGPQPERDGFAAMLAMLRARPGLGVAAYHADRLTRNEEDTAELIRVCSSGDHRVVTARGGSYDLSTANGRKQLRDDASAAIYEVDHQRERVLDARAEVAAEGRFLGGRRPFGWELVPDPAGPDGTPLLDEDGEPVNGILRLVPAEADALARASDDVLDGMTLAGIARTWNQAGLTTPLGKTAGGNRWRGQDVRRVLLRARNAALMEYQGEITGPAAWPAIVTEQAWKNVTAKLADPERKTSPGPSRRHLLSGLAACGVCGTPVVCSAASRTTTAPGRRKYRCPEGTRGHVARDKTAVDDFVTRLVIARLSREDAAALLAADHRDELDALSREADGIRTLMREDHELKTEGLLTKTEFAKGRRKHLARLAEIDQRTTELNQADVLAPMIGDSSASQEAREAAVREKWGGYDLDRRRAVIGALMTIKILPTAKGRPPGWRPGQPYFNPDTIDIEPRRKLPGEEIGK